MSYPENMSDQAFDAATAEPSESQKVMEAAQVLCFVADMKKDLALLFAKKAYQGPFVWLRDEQQSTLHVIFDWLDEDGGIEDAVEDARALLEREGRNDILADYATNNSDLAEKLSKSYNGLFAETIMNMQAGLQND